MKILVLNSGSSSLKCQLFINQEMFFKAIVDGIGLDLCNLDVDYNSSNKKENCNVKNHNEAIKLILDELIKSGVINSLEEIDAIGHRVVHGGELYNDSILIDDEVISNIEKLSEFAPLHNPPNLMGIKACREVLADKPQVAVFDTAFHAKIPNENFMFAIPSKFYSENKVRKYGFHGTSFKYITKKVENEFPDLKKIIICHLGNGSSICAVNQGISIDTSMGFTPLAGLIMGTRCGDIDPALIEYLYELEKKSFKESQSKPDSETECQENDFKIKEISNILNKQSGLKGICGTSDMRDIWKNISLNDDSDECSKSKLALEMLSNSILKYVSYYISQLQGVDGIIFTAGLGENAYYLREKVIEKLSYLGIKLDNNRNKANGKESGNLISTDDSSSKVLVIPTNEELMIAKDVESIVK